MSYVSEGKSVLAICEKVDRRPHPVHGMPPSDINASKKILLKYVKSREEFVQVLTELVELTKVSSLPGARATMRFCFSIEPSDSD